MARTRPILPDTVPRPTNDLPCCRRARPGRDGDGDGYDDDDDGGNVDDDCDDDDGGNDDDGPIVVYHVTKRPTHHGY